MVMQGLYIAPDTALLKKLFDSITDPVLAHGVKLGRFRLGQAAISDFVMQERINPGLYDL